MPETINIMFASREQDVDWARKGEGGERTERERMVPPHAHRIGKRRPMSYVLNGNTVLCEKKIRT
jgi:hypothetical protein